MATAQNANQKRMGSVRRVALRNATLHQGKCRLGVSWGRARVPTEHTKTRGWGFAERAHLKLFAMAIGIDSHREEYDEGQIAAKVHYLRVFIVKTLCRHVPATMERRPPVTLARQEGTLSVTRLHRRPAQLARHSCGTVAQPFLRPAPTSPDGSSAGCPRLRTSSSRPKSAGAGGSFRVRWRPQAASGAAACAHRLQRAGAQPLHITTEEALSSSCAAACVRVR